MKEKPKIPLDHMQNDLETHEQEDLLAMLTEHLQPLPVSPVLLEALGNRLESRIQTSVAKHEGLHTVRFREGIWHKLVAGIRYKPLWNSPLGNSVLIEFSPGTTLPLHRHNFLEEGIVLSGGLQLDDLELTQLDYHVSPAGSHHGQIRSREGGLAYLRGSSVGQPLSMLKEVLGGLLPKNHLESVSIYSHEGHWHEIHKGFFQKELLNDGNYRSRFMRLAPDKKISGHFFSLDEEYMVLSGDMYLGDILLQQGDYSIVPAGTEQLELASDNGVLFYVRGACQESS